MHIYIWAYCDYGAIYVYRLAEDATTNDVCTPDNITMAMIAEASYESEDYWKIVDVLHRRSFLILISMFFFPFSYCECVHHMAH